MESYTFLDFLDFKFLKGSTDKVQKIEVPMLQRDYAQGRRSQIAIANAFLDALFAVLEGRSKKLHLDLVYGYEEDKTFKLIDGQQRVTTLWLLYFLLYRRAGQLDTIKDKLKRFSYSTRKSSKDFCRKLLDKAEYFKMDVSPSQTIKQGGTFGEQEDLNNDPTIKAMVSMLGYIHERLQGKNLESLISGLNNISLSVINMQNFGLGEDLYIKMNARGKLLSKFENLKAFIEQANLPPKLLANMDNEWSDYFFDDKKPNTFDDHYFHFLHYANVFFALDSENPNGDNKNQEGQEISLTDILNTERAIDKSYGFLQNKDNLKLLDRMIDCLPKWQSEGKELWFFEVKEPKFFSQKLENKKVCYFFALLFMTKADVKKLDLDYLRTCGHFIENHRLDKPEDIVGFFELFKEISKGIGSNFYEFLSEHKRESQFHETVYDLEKRKAKLISDNPNWKEALEETSDHRYLVGYMGFLLDFSRVDGKEDLEKFKDYAKLTMEILDTFLLNGKEDDLALFQRAFLCFGDYSIEATNQFFGNCHKMGMFRYRELVFRLFENKPNEGKPYFQRLLDNLLNSPKQTLQEKMEHIVKNYTRHQGEQLSDIPCQLQERSWWEQLLIQQKELFVFINSRQDKECGRIKIDYQDNQEVYLLERKNFSEKTFKDLLGYALYCYCKQQGIKGLSSEYESGTESRQFTINDFAIFADSKESVIKIAKTRSEEQEKDSAQNAPTELEERKINLRGDILKEFEKVLTKILEIVER
ncbi:DUF262 domain-containing protein [Helicobacter suis]|uniref:DUF262 domain-containing protein n=1 Tax=Helicobacter suis TaxID=104628 RepID=UPI0013D4844B|nr:DUF262 domain-containing protein [Helicobacter suis]